MEKLTEKLFVPENDMQEFWELNGRVKAVLAWLEGDPFIRREILAGMLGDESKREEWKEGTEAATPVPCQPSETEGEGDGGEAEETI